MIYQIYQYYKTSKLYKKYENKLFILFVIKTFQQVFMIGMLLRPSVLCYILYMALSDFGHNVILFWNSPLTEHYNITEPFDIFPIYKL